MTVSEAPAARLANEQLIDWPTEAVQSPAPVAVSPLTARRPSTASLTTTLWVVLKAPVLVTRIVKVWPVVPAVTLASVKVLTSDRLASLVMSTLAVLDAVAGTSSKSRWRCW